VQQPLKLVSSHCSVLGRQVAAANTASMQQLQAIQCQQRVQQGLRQRRLQRQQLQVGAGVACWQR
jgi:hypothetical protein